MSKGYVYVLTNPHIPNLVKIGYTDREPRIRAKELSSFTGVPGKWNVHEAWCLDDAYDCEQRIFAHFARHRQGGEFFALAPDAAVDAISVLLSDWRLVPVGTLSPTATRLRNQQEAERRAAARAARIAEESREREQKLRAQLGYERDIANRWKSALSEERAAALVEAEKKLGYTLAILETRLCAPPPKLALRVRMYHALCGGVAPPSQEMLAHAELLKETEAQRRSLLKLCNKVLEDRRMQFFFRHGVTHPPDD